MATWWRKPDGSRVLVLDVFHGVDGVDDYDCCVLDLTPEVARAYLQLIEQVKAWKGTIHDLSYVAFWNYDVEYFGRNYDDEAVDATDEDGNTAPRWERGEYDSRTEMNHVEVSDDSVQWTAWVKHSDPPITLSSEYLREEELKQFIAGEDPWPEAVAGPVWMQEG